MKVLLINNVVLCVLCAALLGLLIWQNGKIRKYGRLFAELSKRLNRSIEEMEAEVQANTADLSRSNVIHRRGDTCPPGWKLLPGYFQRKDGTTRDGCQNPNPNPGQSIDYLMPGESAPLSFEVLVTPPVQDFPKHPGPESVN